MKHYLTIRDSRIGRPKRLLALAEMLETMKLPRRAKFNMEVFGDHKKDHPPEEGDYCGTSACAMGWAALNPKFNKLGLYMTWEEYWDGSMNGTITFEGATDFSAAAKFFGISLGASNYLFYPEEYPQDDAEKISRKFVAKRIRKFVETREFKRLVRED